VEQILQMVTAPKGQLRILHAPECWLVLVGLAVLWLFPDDLGFATTVIINALFVLSLSLVLGQAGVMSMGHAAVFGSGAYSAGLVALHVTGDPLIGLVLGGVAGALVAFVSGLMILRAKGLTLVMLTIAASQILLEVANKARAVTGGDDGLSGFSVRPILGYFEFDFYGVTAYLYSLAVLIAVYFVVRKVVASPFGLSSRAIKDDPSRMTALGCNVYVHLVAVFVIGGFIGGLAGALSAQTTRVVGLNTLDFQTSAGALVMLVLGGMARLPGALIGTFVYMVVHHAVSTADPYHWLFVIGFMLIITMLVLPQGLIQLFDGLQQIVKRGAVHD
jgi:branched-chain amino acid transport system permease protein